MVAEGLDLEDAIVKIIEDMGGIKLVDLGVKLINDYPHLKEEATGKAILNEVDRLARDEELVEVEYTLPADSYRIKSFLLPKGTEMVSRG